MCDRILKEHLTRLSFLCVVQHHVTGSLKIKYVALKTYTVTY